jgi:hypothetical protein
MTLHAIRICWDQSKKTCNIKKRGKVKRVKEVPLYCTYVFISTYFNFSQISFTKIVTTLGFTYLSYV